MLKSKLLLGILIGMFLAPSLLQANTSEGARSSCFSRSILLDNPSDLDQQTLRQVLLMVQHHHPQYNYGTLRSRYAQGRLIIIKTVTQNADLYTVRLDGIEICVLMPI